LYLLVIDVFAVISVSKTVVHFLSSPIQTRFRIKNDIIMSQTVVLEQENKEKRFQLAFTKVWYSIPSLFISL